jgi:hypothetical protein
MSDRWKRVVEVFDSAVDRDPDRTLVIRGAGVYGR